MLLSAKRKINEKDYMRIINETVYNPFFLRRKPNHAGVCITTALLIKPHIVSAIHVYSMLVSLLPI